jgi:hypothetical protein
VQEEDQKTESTPFLLRVPPGYFQCKRAIRILKTFQGLVYHREGWRPLPGSPTYFIPALETLIPSDTPESAKSAMIQQEISKLIVPVHVILNDAGVFTRWLYRSRKQAPLPFSTSPSPEQEKREYDIIRQYFELPQSLENFEIIVRTLNQGIGVFEMRERAAFWEIFNPLYWFSLILRAPLWVFYRAGFSPSQRFYEGFIKTVFGAVLILLLIHYGTLGWDDFTSWLVK